MSRYPSVGFTPGTLRLPLGVAVLLLTVLAPGAAVALPDHIVSYAIVQDNATLKMRGKTIRLFGIHIPETEENCRTFIRPVRCRQRAAQALEFKKNAKFVRCKPVRRNEDRSITAVCSVDGTDLGKYLISRGWAVALPSAPFEYKVAERIARHHNLGVWGFTADLIEEGVGPR